MTNLWSTALRLFLWMILLTGVIYPLIITGIAQLFFYERANGDFLISQDKIVGAKLIAQKFTDNKYFWPRPSSVDYNPLPSGGSNLGPTSAALKKAVGERKEVIAKAAGNSNSAIPSELLYASGSGLDPHISPKAAYFQIDRIIKARSLDPQKGKKDLTELIDKNTEKRLLDIIGKPCVNVLLLNQALDESLNKQKK